MLLAFPSKGRAWDKGLCGGGVVSIIRSCSYVHGGSEKNETGKEGKTKLGRCRNCEMEKERESSQSTGDWAGYYYGKTEFNPVGNVLRNCMECACEMSETKNEGIFTHGSCPTGQMSPRKCWHQHLYISHSVRAPPWLIRLLQGLHVTEADKAWEKKNKRYAVQLRSGAVRLHLSTAGCYSKDQRKWWDERIWDGKINRHTSHCILQCFPSVNIKKF